MKGLKAVSKKTKGINYSSRVALYYSPSKDAVSTTAGEDKYYLTDLIRENTPQEIEETVNRFKRL